MKKVFISYSSRDLEWAKEICLLLESNSAKCFMSARDLDRTKPGWAAELVKALADSDYMLLLLTRDSAASNEVLNEVSNASASGKNIIPILKENLPVRDDLMYFIRKYEWICLFDFSEEDGKKILLGRIFGSRPDNVRSAAVRVSAKELTQYEDVCFAGINVGGYGAGFDKCLMQNGVNGWKTSDVVLEEVIDEEFTFASAGMPELDEEYKAYCQTKEVKKMQARGNDRTRWMVAGLYQNNRIFVTLQRTKYSMTSFWWDKIRNDPLMQKKMARQVFEQEDVFFPNSFCLHVILETQDEKLICTRISNNKKNDYAKSIAVTLGEQISEIDFASNTFNNDAFTDQWIKRSLIEELNIFVEDYEKFVDVSSVRVLALSYEGDIYNFALPVYVRLKMDYDGLITYLNSSNKNNSEYTEIIPMTAAEALDITKSWNDVEKRSIYHPSSFLRALLYAIYKGADK